MTIRCWLVYSSLLDISDLITSVLSARFSALRSEQTAFGAGTGHRGNDGLPSRTGRVCERERAVE
ncbi:hypothetical protein J6590_102003 [Homalodisca vitripennis]|nr:hypothetical protein J6590_102003 [Homalodisca vitripennis]